VKEVTLILVGVETLEQPGLAVVVLAPHIVAGGDHIGAEDLGVFEEHLELDFAVAEDIRVGSATGLVLGEEVLEDIVPVFGGEIGSVQFDTQFCADFLRIGEIRHGGAVLAAVVFIPVFHEQAFHPVALFEQQQGGDRGVNTAGHPDYYGRLCHQGAFPLRLLMISSG